MRKSGFVLLVTVASLFSLSSCEDWLDVKKTFTFEHEFHVTSGDLSFQEFVIIEMQNEESLIEEYGSKIKDIEIEEVRYWLTDHQGSLDQQYNSLILDVAEADGSDSRNIVTLQDVVLAPLLGTPAILSTNDQGIEKLSDLIRTPPHTFSLDLAGDVNEVPVDFRVVFEFKIRMTANPL